MITNPFSEKTNVAKVIDKSLQIHSFVSLSMLFFASGSGSVNCIRLFRVIITPSVTQTLLRRENDSKQSDEIRATGQGWISSFSADFGLKIFVLFSNCTASDFSVL